MQCSWSQVWNHISFTALSLTHTDAHIHSRSNSHGERRRATVCSQTLFFLVCLFLSFPVTCTYHCLEHQKKKGQEEEERIHCKYHRFSFLYVYYPGSVGVPVIVHYMLQFSLLSLSLSLSLFRPLCCLVRVSLSLVSLCLCFFLN